MTHRSPGARDARWILLIHQIPPRPPYLRVKIGRHLQRIGAVAIKNSVYVLPHSEETQEDFQWVLREVVKGGGDASIVEARFIDGLSDEQVLALFQAAREADCREIAEQAREVATSLPKRGPPPENRRNEVEPDHTAAPAARGARRHRLLRGTRARGCRGTRDRTGGAHEAQRGIARRGEAGASPR